MGVCKTETAIIIGLVLHVILLAAVANYLRSLSISVSALEQKILAGQNSMVEPIRAIEPIEAFESNETVEANEIVEQESPVVKPVGTGALSPALVAVITGAIAACLDDLDMERHTISSIQSTL